MTLDVSRQEKKQKMHDNIRTIIINCQVCGDCALPIVYLNAFCVCAPTANFQFEWRASKNLRSKCQRHSIKRTSPLHSAVHTHTQIAFHSSRNFSVNDENSEFLIQIDSSAMHAQKTVLYQNICHFAEAGKFYVIKNATLKFIRRSRNANINCEQPTISHIN